MLFMVKGNRLIAATIAFLEAFIWFVVVREALTMDEKSILIAVAFALGFSVGTYIGGMLAKKFIPGKVTIQAFISKKDTIEIIRNKGYAVTALEYDGIKENEKKYMLYINVDKTKEEKIKALIKELDKSAFIVINESKYVANGYFK